MINVFISYSHKDASTVEELQTHLSMLKRGGVIETWDDTRTSAGKELYKEIIANIEKANLIILIISPYFLESNYCYEIEMPQALERYRNGLARVIPVIAQHCDWQNTPLGKLKAIPKDGRPISNYPNKHDAFCEITKSIKEVALELAEDVPKLLPIDNKIGKDKNVYKTSVIGFKTEIKPIIIDIQRVVHKVTSDKKNTYIVPLEFDHRIPILIEKIETLYTNFESVVEDKSQKVSMHAFSNLHSTRTKIIHMIDTFPQILGRVVTRLCRSPIELCDIAITETVSRFIELSLTKVISDLTSYQLRTDQNTLFPEYDDNLGNDGYVAKLDGIKLEELVSYHILLFGDAEERIIYAPAEYGHSNLLISREFIHKGVGYIPPISFITDYLFPQMFLRNWDKEEKWNIEWRCHSVFVKDLDGNYL